MDRRSADLKFIRDVLFSYVGPVMLRARSFLLIPLLTRTLGMNGYGVWTQFEATTALFISLSSLNLGFGMNRLLAGDLSKERISDDIFSILTVQIGFASLLVIPLIVWPRGAARFIFDDGDLYIVSFCLAFIALSKVLGNCFWAMMRARRLNKELALVNSIRWWGELIVIAISLFFGGRLIALFVTLATYNAISNASYPLYASNRGVYTVKTPRFSRLIEYLKFSLPLFGNTIGFWIINSGDKYLIKWFLGIESVGIYAALYKFGNLIMLILTPIIEVLLPDMAYLYDAGELSEMKRRLVLTLKYYGIISSFAIVGLVGSSRLLVAIADLREQSVLMSTGMLLLLSLSSTLMGLSRILLDALSVKGKTWTIGWVWVGSAVLNVLFSLILIPLLGIQGAAVSAFLIFVACLAGVTLIVKRSYVQFSIWEGWGGRVLISLILSVLVAWLMTINLPVIFPLGALVSIGIFVGLLFIMGLFGSKEISRTLEAIKEMGV